MEPGRTPSRAPRARRTGVARELWQLLRHNKKWWMAPIVAVFLLLAAVAFLSATGAVPFIYTMF